MTISGKGYNASSEVVSSKLADKIAEAKKGTGVTQQINSYEMKNIVRTALADDGELSAKEADMINAALKEQGGLVDLNIESANKFSFKIKNTGNGNKQFESSASVITTFNDSASINSFMSTTTGQNITTSLGIPNPPVTKLDKSSFAFNAAMVEKRDEYKQKFAQYIKVDANDNISYNGPEMSKLFNSKKPEDKKLLESIILEAPDLSFLDKRNDLRSYGVATSVTDADNKIKSNVNMMKGDLTLRTQAIYENMGGTGKASTQYLSAVGDGSQTTGIALKNNLCVGYFQYEKVGTGTASENNFKIKVPVDENLELKLGAYGFNDTSKSDFKMSIGGQIDLNFKLAPGTGGKGQLELDLTNINDIKTFLTSKGVTLTGTTEANVIAGLKKAGITIDVANNSLTLDSKKYGGLDIQNKMTGATSSDERQIQVSTNGNLTVGSNNKLFEAKDLYDVAKFTAEKSKMTTVQQNLITSLAASLKLPDLTTRPQEVDLNQFFNATGGSVNPDAFKDGELISGLTSNQKDNLRSTSATPGAGGKIDIVSYTDPDKTGVHEGKNNDFHDYFNNDVGADLKKAFVDNKVYLAGSGENNNTLSAMRTLSFVKLTVMEKYKDLQPPLSADDFAKMTISVKVKDQDGKEVTINAKLSDVPPK